VADICLKTIDLQKLLNQPRPSLIIYDETWEAEQDVRRWAEKMAKILTEESKPK